MKKIAVIGAGASALMFAGCVNREEFDVTVFEKNDKVGKKLYITGKGRCNLTNFCEPDDFLRNVVRGDKFMRSAIYSFTPHDCVEFFENLGLKTKVERGNRVFPASDKSNDVIKALVRHCDGVNFSFNEDVKSISTINEKFLIKTEKNNYEFDRVVVATGGKSYSATGSDGSGYKFAKIFGHTVEPCVPALCPIKLKNKFNMQGLSLKNVNLKAEFDGKKKEFFGEMLFTDIGISGPIVLTCSSFINRANVVKLILDLKPALSLEQLDARLLRDFDENKNKNFASVLKGLLPSAMCECFSQICKISLNKKIHDITKAERIKIVQILKNFPLEYDDLYDIETGIVTSGGVNLKEINPKTFESKLVPNLYFIGEVLDVDALTGGFNLQIAFACGYLCAKNLHD